MRKIRIPLLMLLIVVIVLLFYRRGATTFYSHDLKSANGIVEHIDLTHYSETQRMQYASAMDALENGDFRKAENIYRKLIDDMPSGLSAYHGLGSALTYQNRLSEAEAAFNKALSIKTDYAPSLSGLGAISAIRKEYNQSISYYTRALDSDPKYGVAHWGLAVELYNLNKCEQANIHFKLVVAYLPGSKYAEKSKKVINKCNLVVNQ